MKKVTKTGRVVSRSNEPYPSIRICKPDADITAGGSGTVTIWDGSVSPPVATTETVTAVLDWMHGGTKVSAGKECGIVRFGNTWRIMFAECE